MPQLNEMSNDWDIVKVTIGATGIATPDSQMCQECTMFQSTGTGATVQATGKEETLPLPTTLAESFSLKIDNLDKLTFAGAENDVITIVWRGMIRW
ncbi:MAG: hypothetical protein LLF76_02270 [Planctomycetaceae bacterium]|nr:hypothetical protein [Planctomycetaceae bacterium]